MTSRTETPELTWAAVWTRRLERHALATPLPDARPADLVARICGAHAQVLVAAELSIGLRLTGCTRSAVQDALWIERSLVKTIGPRGTVHLLPTQELPLWIGALSALPVQSNSFPPNVRLTSWQTEEVVDAVAAALSDATLTVDELGEAILAATGPWAGDLVMPAFQGLWPRWRQALTAAAHRGVLCFGPNRGRQVTYTSPQQWLPGFQPDPAHFALAELLRRYLLAYGPATPEHLAKWLGVSRRWATDLFTTHSDTLQQVVVEGTQAWLAAGDTEMPSVHTQSVRLLPYFDPYVVGCHPRSLLFPDRVANRALSRSGQAGTFPVLLIDGIVAGIWNQQRTGQIIQITVDPVEHLTPNQHHELEEQVQRIGVVLEGTAQLTIGPVLAGGHL